MNRKRWLINYLLLFGVVALGYLATTGKTPEKKSLTGRADISPLQAEQVMWLRITQQGQPEALLERLDNGWRVREPASLPADSARVEQLLKLVDTKTYMHFAAEQETLAQYGLANPRYRLHFNDQEFVFGNTNPLNQRRYMGVGEQVVQTDDRFLYQLTNGWGALADRQLLPEADQITQLELPAQTITAAANTDAGWTSTASPAPDPETLAITADLWRSSRAQKLRTTTNWRGAPIRIHTLHNGQQRLFEFRVERGNNGYWLHRLDSGVSYQLSVALGHRLLYPGMPLNDPQTDH